MTRYPDPTGGLIPGLELWSHGTGVEVYRYTDPTDGARIGIWIDSDDSFVFGESEQPPGSLGPPEIPGRVIRWLAARAEYLRETGGPPWQT